MPKDGAWWQSKRLYWKKRKKCDTPVRKAADPSDPQPACMTYWAAHVAKRVLSASMLSIQ